eukprot:3105819-Pyramimonas_sp.AAC.1
MRSPSAKPAVRLIRRPRASLWLQPSFTTLIVLLVPLTLFLIVAAHNLRVRHDVSRSDEQANTFNLAVLDEGVLDMREQPQLKGVNGKGSRGLFSGSQLSH